jgi:hypothetical protein
MSEPVMGILYLGCIGVIFLFCFLLLFTCLTDLEKNKTKRAISIAPKITPNKSVPNNTKHCLYCGSYMQGNTCEQCGASGNFH